MAVFLPASLLFAFLTAYSIFSLLIDTPTPTVPSQPPLTLAPSHTFKLALFSDLHYGEEESGWGIEQDANSTRVIQRVLSAEHPVDLAVLAGDLITGENTLAHNSSAYVRRIAAPLVAAGVPWASVYGNHDSKANLSRAEMLAVERGYGGLSYTRTTDGLEGTTNYYLLLYRRPEAGHNNKKDEVRPVAVLWFFDSRGGTSYGNYGAGEEDDIPNWVSPETARWFRAEAIALRSRYRGKGGVLPGLAFVHIPPRAFLAAQRRGIDPALFPGVNEDVPVAVQGPGGGEEFADALREEGVRGGLHSVYVGHDHGNAWCALWPRGGGDEHAGAGPVLCFGKHSGYGGYGDWNRGARIVQLRFVEGDGEDGGAGKMEVETWVRMEGGQVVTRVMLNETYGTDRYPTADGEWHG